MVTGSTLVMVGAVAVAISVTQALPLAAIGAGLIVYGTYYLK